MLIQKTLEFWSSKLSYAEYEAGGKTYKVILTNNKVDVENNRLIIDFDINEENAMNDPITKVTWYDDNGDVWDESEENIIRESYVEGILYRYILTLTKEG